MRFTDLIFDLYGTLADIHTDENALAWEKTALCFGYYGAHYTGPELRAAFEAEMLRREAAAGQSYEVYPDIPFDGVLADLFRAKGITTVADALALHAAQVFRIAATEYIRLYDGVLDALAAFRSAGLRLWLLSNAQQAFTACELRLLKLDNRFDGVYLSSDHQYRKPDLRFFRTLLKEQRLDPQTCLMIGNDRETDIAGARSAGIPTLYMHTNLTPAEQAAADPLLHPDTMQPGQTHFEVEGADWAHLTTWILQMTA